MPDTPEATRITWGSICTCSPIDVAHRHGSSPTGQHLAVLSRPVIRKVACP